MAQPSNSVFDPIKYLVDRKFPYFRDSEAFRMRMLPRPNMNKPTADLLIEKYKYELDCFWPEEIRDLVKAELATERQEVAFYEGLKWFSNPGCAADFDYWCKASFWTLEEAMALTLGKEPRLVTSDSVKAEERFSPFVQEFKQRLELGRRAEIAGQLPPLFNSLTFIVWAKHIDLSCPPEMEALITPSSGSRVDWKAKYEEEAAAHAIAKKELEAREVITKGAGVRPVSPKERESLLKLVIGMAVEKFGYDPKASKSPTTERIATALRTQGIPLDEDTIRKYLQEGREMLSLD